MTDQNEQKQMEKAEQHALIPVEDPAAAPDTLTDYHKEGDHARLSSALSSLVSKSASSGESVMLNLLAPATGVIKKSGWLDMAKNAFSVMGNYADSWNYGNYVIVRKTGEKKWESMPLYARIGMHLLFVGRAERTLLEDGYLHTVFKKESVQSGLNFESPASAANIPHFVSVYKLPLEDLLEPDLTKYKNFNDFFARRLKPDARTIEGKGDETVFTSPADCRCTVFQTIDLATQYWVKGKKFTLGNLIDDDELAKKYAGGNIGLFRLAPQDYHRFHSPADCTIGTVHDIPGTYYTVNPMAVQEDLNVFTENKRSVMQLHHPRSSTPILFVAIGALLVGSIEWTVKEGKEVGKGSELGCFKYGGSTVIVVWPEELGVEFDKDLVENSISRMETVVEVGNRVGTMKV
ncbi:hypothetical protein YB2330_003554 [Saitoella coloradoensis]